MGEYHLSVKSHFDAAHRLYDYPGQCRELHGHTWDVEVTVASAELDEIGIVYDFTRLKADLAGVLRDYDHVLINDVAPFDRMSPTAENLARVIAGRLAEVVEARVRVVEVAVWESPIAKLVYRP
jgi:6-pyruvoyltetrahydropterin/6-carboxytetrahydropterin synthase